MKVYWMLALGAAVWAANTFFVACLLTYGLDLPMYKALTVAVALGWAANPVVSLTRN